MENKEIAKMPIKIGKVKSVNGYLILDENYGYKCPECVYVNGKRTDVIVNIGDKRCPVCGSLLDWRNCR